MSARAVHTALFWLSLSLASSAALAQPADATPPEVLTKVSAEYPESAREAGLEGEVMLIVVVGTDGRVVSAEVELSQGQALDEAALAAVRGWRFAPARRGGAPIAARIRVPFTFQLPEDDEAAAPEAASESSKVPEHTDDDGHDHTTFEDEHGEIIVVGRGRAPSRGASDFSLRLGELGRVPRKNAAELLRLAPGVLLTSEGGEGHAQQIFMRGFDAREGQDLELTVDGIPINQLGNIHGNGYADTNFIIPELVEELRVLEGPFEPQQGNFAVAGSADYRLGLERRGLTLKYLAGSFNTQRLLLLWGPANESHHTFGGVEIYDTEGFGQSRAARRGSAIGQYEWRIGRTGLWRLTGQAYAVDYKSAGVLREDDLKAGRVRFFDTYDPWQGGSASRFSVSTDVEQKLQGTLFKQQVFAVQTGLRLQENYTGFLLDVQQPLQEPHTQRGDRIDKHVSTSTLGARGSARWHTRAVGERQELELGYFARADKSEGVQSRVQASNAVPYATDTDVEAQTANVAAYIDASVKPLHWLNLRGGVRAELFGYDVLNRCAVTSVRFPSGGAFDGDLGCFSQQPNGEYRLPEQRTTTSGSTLLPRAVMVLGPFEGFAFSLAYGEGARAIDPQFVNQDGQAPFSGVTAYEGGVAYAREVHGVTLQARSIFFQTWVEQDYLFSQTAGRNTLADGTTRTGWVGALRATGGFFDVNSNLTLTRATFDDTGLAIPYVPPLVARVDAAVFGELPIRLGGGALSASSTLGLGYVGARPLPYDELSEDLFSVDASAELGWKSFELGLLVTNLLDARQRIGEYNFPSDFSAPGATSLVPARHFSAGAPRAIFGTLAVHLGGP